MVRVVLLFMLLVPISLYAKTYEIVEPDFVETAKTFAKSEEFKKEVLKERDRKVNQIENMQGELLAKAVIDEEYEVEYYYTLPQDIPKVDRDGNIVGILYPKGYTFAPLKYTRIAPPPLIIFNPCDSKELELVKTIKKLYDDNYQRYMLVTSGCSIEKMKDISVLGGSRFLLDKDSIKKFNLKYTVSVVSADLVKGVFNVKVFSSIKQKQDTK